MTLMTQMMEVGIILDYNESSTGQNLTILPRLRVFNMTLVLLIKTFGKPTTTLAVCQQERVVGLHIMGPNAGDILQGFAAAMKCGLTKHQLDSTAGIPPGSAQVPTRPSFCTSSYNQL